MSEVIDLVGDVVEDVVDWAAEAVDDIGDAFEEIGKWTAQAAKDVGGFLDDAVGKDGWLTNFVQDYVPGGGLVTAGIHAAAGNFDYAEYAAVKGASTFVTAAAATAGAILLGPAGAVLLGAAVGAATTAFESGMKQYLAASVKNKIADLSVSGIFIGGAIGGAAAGLGPLLKAGKGALKKLGNGLKKIRNAIRKVRGKPPLAPPIPSSVVKPPGLVKRAIEKGKNLAEVYQRNKRAVTDVLTRPVKNAVRKVRNFGRKLRGKKPLPPKRIGPLTQKETLIKAAKLSPITGTKDHIARERRRRKINSLLDKPSAEPIPASGCIEPTLVAILIVTAILIGVLTILNPDGSVEVASGGTLNPSDKTPAAPPAVDVPNGVVPETPADAVTSGAPDDTPPAPGAPVAPAAPVGSPDDDTETQTPGPDIEPTPLPELTISYRKRTCAQGADILEALVDSNAGNGAPFTIVFTSSVAGTRQVSGFTATQGEVFFVVPISTEDEALAIQSIELAGQQYSTNWGSYETFAPGVPCNPTALTIERDVCWYEEGQFYYLLVVFGSPASPGQTATLVLTAGGVGDADPEQATVESDGEFYYFVPYVEPGWNVSVSSLNIGGTNYSTNFGTYLIPETDFLC